MSEPKKHTVPGEQEMLVPDDRLGYILRYIECKKSASLACSTEYIFDTFRICYVVQGSFDWRIADTVYAVYPGDIVILNNVVSRVIERIHSSEELILDIFEFMPAAVSPPINCLPAFYAPSEYVLRTGKNAGIPEILQTIKDELHNNRFLRKEKIEISLKLAVLEIMRLTGTGDIHTVTTSATRYLISESTVYICNNPTEDLSTSALAKRANMSRGYYCVEFKKYIGISPSQYIRKSRIRNAIRLLQTQQCTVAQAAYNSGFNSVSVFYSTFTAVTGMNPTQYLLQTSTPPSDS